MLNRSILIGAKIRMKEQTLEKLEQEFLVLTERSDELMDTIDSTESEEDLTALEQQIDEVQEKLDQKTKEKETLEKEISDLKAELEELNNKKPTQQKERGREKMETREALQAFVRTQGRSTDGVKIVDGGALVPVELLQPQKVPTVSVDLYKLVSVVSVTTGSGKYPVIKKSNKKMVSTTELEQNPILGKPSINKVDYSIETYRGHLPISQELIDDADYDIVSLIEEDIQEQSLNTRNAEIAKVLKTATAKSVSGLDGLKDVINTSIKSVYQVELIVSDSLFNALDKVKDKNGRYMLQPDVTSATGYSFAGKTIYRLPDDVIGDAEGELKGFVGDAKAFATLFDRKQVSVKWVENDIYGTLLGIFTRFDVQKVDNQAGVYITYTDAV